MSLPDITIRKKDWRVTGVLVNGIEIPGATEALVFYPGPGNGSDDVISVTLKIIARSCTEVEDTD